MINYESPLFVSIVLYTIYVLLLAAATLTVWSAVRGWGMKTADEQDTREARHTALGTVITVAIVLLVTWLTASTTPMMINGKIFADAFWLRTSDMLINTALVLMAGATICIIVSQIANWKSAKRK